MALQGLTLEERFWSKVDKSGTCWIWLAAIHPTGYGSFGVSGRNIRAHRVSFELVNGPIPQGLQLLHSCDNRACVNPAHLSVGTQLDNVLDMISKGRSWQQQRTHCPKGHEYNKQNTIVKGRGRACGMCLAEASNSYKQRKRDARGPIEHYNAAKTQCPNGHEYTKENTRMRPNGGRACRTCENARTTASKRAKKLAAK